MNLNSQPTWGFIPIPTDDATDSIAQPVSISKGPNPGMDNTAAQNAPTSKTESPNPSTHLLTADLATTTARKSSSSSKVSNSNSAVIDLSSPPKARDRGSAVITLLSSPAVAQPSSSPLRVDKPEGEIEELRKVQTEPKKERREVQRDIDEIYSGLYIWTDTVENASYIAETLWTIPPNYVPLRNSGGARRSGLEAVAALFAQTKEPPPACAVDYQALQARVMAKLVRFFTEPEAIQWREAYIAHRKDLEIWQAMDQYMPEVEEVGHLSVQTIVVLLVMLCEDAPWFQEDDGFRLNIIRYHRNLGRVVWAEEVCRTGQGRFVLSLRYCRGRWEAYGPSNGAGEASTDGRALEVTKSMEWADPLFNGGVKRAHDVCGANAVQGLKNYYRMNIDRADVPGSSIDQPIIIGDEMED